MDCHQEASQESLEANDTSWQCYADHKRRLHSLCAIWFLSDAPWELCAAVD
jgi:hypothetical protein